MPVVMLDISAVLQRRLRVYIQVLKWLVDIDNLVGRIENNRCRGQELREA